MIVVFWPPLKKISILAYVLGIILKLKEMEEKIVLTFTLVA
jgi:hypothetical protein